MATGKLRCRIIGSVIWVWVVILGMIRYSSTLHSSYFYSYSTWYYYTLSWFYQTLPPSTTFYHGSTLNNCILLHYIIAVPGSTWLYYTLSLLYAILWLCYTLRLIYFILLDTTAHYHGSTWLYFTLLHCTRLYTIDLLYSTWLYHILPWLYLILLYSIYYSLTCLYQTLLDSTTF